MKRYTFSIKIETVIHLSKTAPDIETARSTVVDEIRHDWPMADIKVIYAAEVK